MPTGDDVVELVSVPVEFQAEAIAASLRERGVPARAVGGGLAGFRAEVPSLVRVVVLRRDLERAKVALERARSESVDIDWEDVDVGEPEDAGAAGLAADSPDERRQRLWVEQRRAANRRRFAVVGLAMAAVVAVLAVRAPLPVVLGAVIAAGAAVAWAGAGALMGRGRAVDPFDRRHW